MKYAIIADVAGQYSALMRLVARIPKEYKLVFLGDLIDRGPDSDLVLEFIINNKHLCVLGNHESLMFDYYVNKCQLYSFGVWTGNGGVETLKLYTQVPSNPNIPRAQSLLNKHLDWIAGLPFKMELPLNMGNFSSLFVSHAPLHSKFPNNHDNTNNDLLNWQGLESSLIWNRKLPKRRQFFQVNGHNSQWGLMKYEDEHGVFGWSLDDSQKGKLTALLLPSQEILQEDY